MALQFSTRTEPHVGQNLCRSWEKQRWLKQRGLKRLVIKGSLVGEPLIYEQVMRAHIKHLWVLRCLRSWGPGWAGGAARQPIAQLGLQKDYRHDLLYTAELESLFCVCALSISGVVRSWALSVMEKHFVWSPTRMEGEKMDPVYFQLCKSKLWKVS